MTAPLASMTGYAHTDGVVAGTNWAWDIRSVNGRGLDLRLRLPAGHDALELGLREAAARLLRRGSVTAGLTLRHEETAGLTVDEPLLDRLLDMAVALSERIPGGLPPRAEALLALPGVLRNGGGRAEETSEALIAAITAGFAAGIDQLVTARRAEGARLSAALTGLLGELAALRSEAVELAAGQPEAQRSRLTDSLRALLRDAPNLPEERIAQEVALLASRSDVREELDRLDSHIAAAHALLSEGANIGRRFDFLVQEFNREANTLCSKSASPELTATGLRLKAVIEQLREQVQNIE